MVSNYIRALIYGSIVCVTVVCVKLKMQSIDSKKTGSIVSIDAIWKEQGKPVEVETAELKKLPKLRKLSANVKNDSIVESYVSLRTRNELKSGQEAYIMAKNGKAIQGEVVAVSKKSDPMSGYYKIELKYEASPHLKVGESLVALVPVSYGKESIKVDRSALIMEKNKYFVWTIGEDKIAHKRSVSVDIIESMFVGIDGGISEGEKVVIRGASKLQEGDMVKLLSEGKSI